MVSSYHYEEVKAGSHGAICSIRLFCAIVTSSKKYFVNQKGVLYQKSHSMIHAVFTLTQTFAENRKNEVLQTVKK